MAGPLDALTATTISNYKMGAEDNCITNNPFLSMFKERGTFEGNQGGTNITWQIEAGRYTAFNSAPGDDMSARFVSSARHKQATLQWADTRAVTNIDFGLLRRNYGDREALVKLRTTETKALWRDLLTNGATSINGQILSQNGATFSGTGLPIYGVPTFLLAPGATGVQGFDPATNTVSGAGPADTDIEAIPTATSQTYASLPLYRSGITGVDGVVADAWTPVLVNSSATTWTGTPDDEANALPDALVHLIARCERFDNQNQDFITDFGVMDQDSYLKLGRKLTKINNGFTIYQTPGADSQNKFGTGLKVNNKIYHSGKWFYWDAAMPASTTYLLNLSQAGWKSAPMFHTMSGHDLPIEKSEGQMELIEVHFDYNPLTQSVMIAGNVNGQVWFNPRYQGRLSAYS
jgi:hypothetical protein